MSYDFSGDFTSFEKKSMAASWRQIMDDGDTWLTAPVPTRGR
jgi:hypothetical protein